MKFVCSVCGYVYEGEKAPEECPICHAPASKFVAQSGEMNWAAEHVVGVAQGAPEDIMADFNFGDGLRKVFLAGVGALATTVEKSQEIVDDLVKKGELTVEQGKALNAELKHKVEEAKEAPESKDAAPAETEDKAE